MASPKVTVGEALLMRAGPDLDVFVFRYVFDGLIEWEVTATETKLSRPIPSFSRKAESSKMLMVRVMMESQGEVLHVSHGILALAEAKTAKQTLSADQGPMWSVKFGEFAGYGKRFEEALCKLAILIKGSGGM